MVVAVVAAAAVIETATAAAPVVHACHWRGNSTLPQQTSRTLVSVDARQGWHGGRSGQDRSGRSVWSGLPGVKVGLVAGLVKVHLGQVGRAGSVRSGSRAGRSVGRVSSSSADPVWTRFGSNRLYHEKGQKAPLSE